MGEENDNEENGYWTFVLAFPPVIIDVFILILITLAFKYSNPLVVTFGPPSHMSISLGYAKILTTFLESAFIVISFVVSILLIIQGVFGFRSDVTIKSQMLLTYRFFLEALFSFICMVLAIVFAVISGTLKQNYINEAIEFSSMHVIYYLLCVLFYILLFAFIILLIIPIYNGSKRRIVLLSPMYTRIKERMNW
jgi:hypothetical protein